jgi:type II secretory pathway component GspD/PulD (secretin)
LKKKLLALIFITLLNNISIAAETITEVIPLFNRPASEMLPLLSPLLEGNDRVIANGSNLIVKMSPERLAELIMLIDKLDTPLNNLIITVIQSRHTTAKELNAAASVRLNNPRNNQFKSSGRITGHYYQTNDQNSNESTQTIRVLEGNPAHISVGNSYPIQNFQIYNSSYAYGYPVVSATTEFIDATTGFAVTPRLIEQNPSLEKKQVILEVSPWSENVTKNGQIKTRNAQSTIKLNLGEWVELGGSDENTRSSTNGNLATIRQTNQNRVHILVKVDKAD